MAAVRANLTIYQGETFERIIRWEMSPFVYKAITGITNAAPVVITAVGHGLATGWRTAVASVLGMVEINAKHAPARDSELVQVTVVDVDHVSLNTVNSAGFGVYVSGGYLQYSTPVDLTGYHARMEIKDRVGGTILLTLTDQTPDFRIVLDNAAHTITLNINAVDTAALAWQSGVYDLEMISPAGRVTRIFSGKITVNREVTT